MIVTIPKISLYHILFACCVGVPYLNNYELTFVIWSTVAALTISRIYSTDFFKQVFCFLAIFTMALFVTLFKEYQVYYIIRDFTYIIKPVLGLLIGYQLCKKMKNNTLEIIVYVGLILAAYHFLLLFKAVIIHQNITVNSLRLYAGYFSDYEVYVVVILLFHKEFNLKFSKTKIIYFSVIIGLSAFLYLARSNFIQFVLLFMAMKGYFKVNKTSVVIIISLTLASIIGYSTILSLDPKRNGDGMEAFLYKLKVAPIEAFKTQINRNDWRDFNDNYRSYENIMTVRQVSREGTMAVLFGDGLGSKIDLKQKVLLGDIEQRYISILHNGFMTVFLKSGLVGVTFFIWSIFLLLKKKKTDCTIARQINLLLIGTGIFLIVSGWVFMGYYFIADTKAILVGFLICYRETAIKNQNLLSQLDD